MAIWRDFRPALLKRGAGWVALRSLERLERAAGPRWQRYRAARLARRLEKEPGYCFTADYVTAVSEVWRLCLAEFAGREDISLLEIGSHEGRSAIWFLHHVLTGPGSTLTCIDPWTAPDAEVRFDHNMRVAAVGSRLTKIREGSLTALPSLGDRRFQIIYVDGTHYASDVLMDAALSWERLAPGGMLIFDDYEWDPGLPPFMCPKVGVDAFLRLMQGRYELVHKGYQVLIRKRSDDRRTLRGGPAHTGVRSC
jgi:predicted O-methyltransferase YrrM